MRVVFEGDPWLGEILSQGRLRIPQIHRNICLRRTQKQVLLDMAMRARQTQEQQVRRDGHHVLRTVVSPRELLCVHVVLFLGRPARWTWSVRGTLVCETFVLTRDNKKIAPPNKFCFLNLKRCLSVKKTGGHGRTGSCIG